MKDTSEGGKSTLILRYKLRRLKLNRLILKIGLKITQGTVLFVGEGSNKVIISRVNGGAYKCFITRFKYDVYVRPIISCLPAVHWTLPQVRIWVDRGLIS